MLIPPRKIGLTALRFESDVMNQGRSNLVNLWFVFHSLVGYTSAIRLVLIREALGMLHNLLHTPYRGYA